MSPGSEGSVVADDESTGSAPTDGSLCSPIYSPETLDISDFEEDAVERIVDLVNSIDEDYLSQFLW